MKTSENTTNLLKGLLQVQKNMNNVIKDSKNPFFKSNYADINALRDELNPLLTDAGLVLNQPVTVFEGKNYIETRVSHAESGEYMSSLTEIVIAKQNDPQSFLAAQTYTRRGSLQSFFNMGAVDDDGNYASGKADKLQNQKKYESPVIKPPTEVKAAIPSTATPEVKKGFGAKKTEIKVEESSDGWS